MHIVDIASLSRPLVLGDLQSIIVSSADSTGRVVRFCDMGQAGQQRRWHDGSLEQDLPMRGLSEMLNVNLFVVSQCNPTLLPVMALFRSMPRKAQLLAEWELKHRLGQMLQVGMGHGVRWAGLVARAAQYAARCVRLTRCQVISPCLPATNVGFSQLEAAQAAVPALDWGRVICAAPAHLPAAQGSCQLFLG